MTLDVVKMVDFFFFFGILATNIAIESGISVINISIKSGNSFTKKLDKSGK